MGLIRSRPRYSIHHNRPTARNETIAMMIASTSRIFKPLLTVGGRLITGTSVAVALGIADGVALGASGVVVPPCDCGAGDGVCVMAAGGCALFCAGAGVKVGGGVGVGVLVGIAAGRAVAFGSTRSSVCCADVGSNSTHPAC